MFKSVKDKVCCFDVEWVPDLDLARRMYDLEVDGDITDSTVLQRVYQEAGATEENPKPFIKPMLCRIVSIACVTRDFTPTSERPLSIWSTSDNIHSEAKMIDLFLNRVGSVSPQLVGWNSSAADIPILMQRAIANGVQAPGFFKRPDKPWEGRDYFDGNSDWHIDLMHVLSRYDRRTRPKLNEAALACGIPGKFDVDGSDVAEMYLADKIDEIRNYNECDSLTTFLIWLRMAYCAGFFTQLEYQTEVESLKALLGISEQEHRHRYLEAMK